MKYTIIIKRSGLIYTKDGKKYENISVEDMLEFISNHDMKLYKVEQSKSIAINQYTSSDEKLNEYKKSLSLAQINDINTGGKIIKFSEEIGYYLVKNKELVESNISLSQLPKSDVEIKISAIKSKMAKCDNLDFDTLKDLANDLMDVLNNEI